MVRWRGAGSRSMQGHPCGSPDAEFGEVRQRKSDKADVEHFDAETLNTEHLRKALGAKVFVVLDMASSDSTLAEMGECLGFVGQYATRMAGKEVREAVTALDAALS